MSKKVIVLLAILLGIYFLQLLPSIYISRLLTDELAKEVDYSQELVVELDSFPSFKMLYGSVDTLNLSADTLEVDGIVLTDLKAEYRAVKFDRANDDWLIRRANTKELDFKLRADDLYNYLKRRSEFDIFSKFELDFLPEQGLFLAGKIEFLEYSLFLQLLGEFELVNEQEVRFVVTEISVEDYRFATEVIKPIRDRLTFRLDFSDLPIPLEIEKIEIKEDYLNILG